MAAYYNEIDPYAAKWLRNLIAAGHIAAGEVDERSIEDVRPDDVRGFTQCHWFAGIGVWSYSLRLAGWADDRPVWTGSCPCQPFSAAGKGAGFNDERHLWPAWHHLVQECRPPAIFGEQVAGKNSGPWLDLVHDDLEALGYAFGAVPFPSASVGAPHIRDRLYWVANTGRARLERRDDRALGIERSAIERGGADGGLADAERHASGCETEPANTGQSETDGPADRFGGCSSAPSRLADAKRERIRTCGPDCLGSSSPALQTRDGERQRIWADTFPVDDTLSSPAGPTNGFWADADWLLCRDGKWRPVEPGTFPLAHGATSRVGRLRAYGNAINAETACAFIEASMK